ncbi:MAG TPA: hypothetical protein VM711_01960, partial [Sphingomicrobium sp.]|nr:hypothetical protein [Sphingomicrobium sp.]
QARLIPVAVMIDGRFYDAGAYKADPVPLALQPDTVYEGLESGVSRGLFTVGGAVHIKDNWLAQGNWRTTEQIEADKARVKAAIAKRAEKAPSSDEQVGGPPRLQRPRAASSPPASPSPQPPPSKPAPQAKPAPNSPPPSEAPATIEAPDRPVLRRQAASDTPLEQTKATEPEKFTRSVRLLAAVSDADGPEPRPYSYQTTPQEEQGFLKKMLALAADEVWTRASQLSVHTGNGKAHTARPAPAFTEVKLRSFDLSNTNEVVLVLTANVKLPAASPDLEYMTAIVARQDIYGDLHKAFVRTTDNEHLDVTPRYELVDAVDVDGDGRGELLFRTNSDTGSSFSIYRVLGDQLWPLYEGKTES